MNQDLTAHLPLSLKLRWYSYIIAVKERNEFKNQLIDDTLSTFGIARSLSMKGCPYDNAVGEATFKIIKTELVNGETFENLEELNYTLADYANRFNNHRIHYRLITKHPISTSWITLKKLSSLLLTIQDNLNKRYSINTCK